MVESSCVDNYEDGDQFILFRNNTNCVGASFIRANPLNVKELLASDFKVYPNPSFGNFSIQSTNESIHTVQIATIDGHVIQDLAFDNSSKKTLEINDLPKGIYLVNINATCFHKIVVN